MIKKTRDQWEKFFTEEITREQYDLETWNLPGTNEGTRVKSGVYHHEMSHPTLYSALAAKSVK